MGDTFRPSDALIRQAAGLGLRFRGADGAVLESPREEMPRSICGAPILRVGKPVVFGRVLDDFREAMSAGPDGKPRSGFLRVALDG